MALMELELGMALMEVDLGSGRGLISLMELESGSGRGLIALIEKFESEKKKKKNHGTWSGGVEKCRGLMALMELELGSVDTTIIKLITNTNEREAHQRRVNYRTRPSFKTLVLVSSQG